jgi:large subunit ribosomal protein L21
MYAVIVSGGKQHKVVEGEVLKLEKIEAPIGNKVVFDEVLMLVDANEVKLGAPTVKGAKVEGEIVAQGRGDKIRIIKFRRRKHHMKTMGHRQYLTTVKITKIV